jgi:O-antigen/teichoic acid export membrane protein
MRSLTTAFSLTLAVIGVTIAAIVPAAAVSTVLPEPMTGLVFGAGLVGAALIRRRNKK